MSEAAAATAPSAAPNAGAGPSKPRRKRTVLLLAALTLCAAGGAGAWWFLLRAPEGEDAKAAREAARKPLFTTLEPFTVNLQDPRGERFAQIGVTLQIDDPQVELAIKDRLPAVRNEILLLISSKQIDELLTLEGKQELAQQIRVRSARVLGVGTAGPGKPAAADNPIRQVLFSQFIVQ